MLLIFIYIIIFILLSGFFAMIDAAVLSVTPAEIESMVNKKLPAAQMLKKLNQQINKAVVIIVLYTNIINILGPILVGKIAVEIYGDPVIGIITTILTFGTIIFSEIIPKSIGVRYSPAISRLVSPFILVSTYVLFPLVWILENFSKIFQRGKRKIGTESQIKSLVTLGRQAGYIESDESELIHRTFTLNDKKACDVMVKCEKIISVNINMNIQEASQIALKSDFSRFPVLDPEKNIICGFIISHDLLEAHTTNRDSDSIQTILRKPLLINAEQKLDDILRIFKKSHIHLGLVHNKNRFCGLITLEDVIEELVGPIVDEKE